MSHLRKMPGNTFIFKGNKIISRTAKKIDPATIIQKSFEVGAVEKNIPLGMNRIERFIKKFPFCGDRLIDFIIAISEALQNAILHGSQSAKRKVGINILYIPEEMLFVGITDDLGPLPIEGIKFDVVDRKCRLNISDCDRGFFLMIKLCSIVAYYPNEESDHKEIILGLLKGDKKRKDKKAQP